MNVRWHSGQGKELIEAANDSWRSHVFTREYEGKPTVLVYDIEEVTIAVIRWQWALEIYVQPFEGLRCFDKVIVSAFVEARFALCTNTALFSDLSYFFQ